MNSPDTTISATSASSLVIKGESGKVHLHQRLMKSLNQKVVGAQGTSRIFVLKSGTVPDWSGVSELASVVNRSRRDDYVLVTRSERFSAADEVDLLRHFKCPDRVEIAETGASIRHSVREVILKSASQGNRWSAGRTGRGGGAMDCRWVVVWSGGRSEEVQRAVLEAAAETLADLQGASKSDPNSAMCLADRPRVEAGTEIEIDVTEANWRERLQSALGGVLPRKASPQQAPRPGGLDEVESVLAATRDLRTDRGKLSATAVAKVFGVPLAELARWLGRTKQAVGKTPDAESLQSSLEFFDRVARLRTVTQDAAEFRKWLRTPNRSLAQRRPLDLLAQGQWQALADKVDDMLTGAPG